MDNDYWADHDEPLAILDSEENRRDNPGGFIWDCCDTFGDEICEKKFGCLIGHHLSLQGAKRKIPDSYSSRHVDSPETTDSEDDLSDSDNLSDSDGLSNSE